MRKKSHILLARYLADQMESAESLQSHRKAFCLGSILPDIRPSFVTKRHEYFGTFGEIQEKIVELINQPRREMNERVFWRRFGEVIHYVADYFTFPHNLTYTGSLMEHNRYEKELKNTLKDTIESGKAGEHISNALYFENSFALLEYIRDCHERYLRKIRNIKEDIAYILSVCFQVIQGVFQLYGRMQAVAF